MRLGHRRGRPGHRRGRRGARLAVLTLIGLAAPAGSEPSAPVVALAEPARAALEPLGEGVVLEALPATPITDPARLRHLEPGSWTYRIVDGANRGQEQHVRVERAASDDPEASWRLVTEGGDIQRLKVTTEHKVVKLSQDDPQSDRLIVYRPGLVLESGLRVGQAKKVDAKLATYKSGSPDDVEYEGTLAYEIRYLGAYRVKTPAGSFDTRLLEHEYTMKIGPAKAHYRSFGFYAEDVGNVAEVSEESVKALLVYRRSSRGARVLLAYPESR
jgi:hypothetical protein